MLTLTNRQLMDEANLKIFSKQIAPALTTSKHKGQAGRIGVFGGSLEYTGAPYFAAISALKVGADLVHVFCAKDAGAVIKSYSPELIVHPLLDDSDAINKIEPWLERLHVVLIGPGLGRDTAVFDVIVKVIDSCRAASKPLVIDADGLFLVTTNSEIIRDYPPPGVILTPNAAELARLIGTDNPESIISNSYFDLGKNITVLCKGAEDKITNFSGSVILSSGGSGRRCGGQGDLLAGSLATFFAWAVELKTEENLPHCDKPTLACYAACKLTKECNARAFQKKGRSMICSDMIEEIHGVFEELFELE